MNFISQNKYAGELLNKFGLINYKAISTLAVHGEKFKKEEDSGLVDATMNKSLIGGLLFLCATVEPLTTLEGGLNSVVAKVLNFLRKLIR